MSDQEDNNTIYQRLLREKEADRDDLRSQNAALRKELALAKDSASKEFLHRAIAESKNIEWDSIKSLGWLELQRECSTLRERIAELEAQVKQETLVSDRLRLSWREDVETERKRLTELIMAVDPILKMVKVGYNTNLVHLEINGVPAFRPLEPAIRDELGTLFTYLYNAQVAIDAARAAMSPEASQDKEVEHE